MSIVDSTVQNHPYQLILVYASSGCSFQELAQDVEKLLEPKMKTIITGDFNFDKNESNVISNFFGTEKLEQIVPYPTHDEGRAIDHCYVTKDVKEKIGLTLHSPYYSDHDALCINIEM